MDEEKTHSENTPEPASAADPASAPGPLKGPKENLYDRIPLTTKQLDVILIILIAAFVFFFVVGALIGNGVI